MITVDQVRKRTGMYFQQKDVTMGERNKLLQVRQTGKVKTWKRNPSWFEIPVKYGLFESFYITNFDHWKGSKWLTRNDNEWEILHFGREEIEK